MAKKKELKNKINTELEKNEKKENIEVKETVEKKEKEEITKLEEEEKNNNEKLGEATEKELLTKQENEISEVKLEKIEEEIKKQTTISDDKKKKIYKRIFKNIIAAIMVIIYFMFINLGYVKLIPETYLIDQQVFSIITLGIAIIIFEKAYKKDDSEIAIFGIETLALAICTLMTISIVENYGAKYTNSITIISIIFAIYYVAKSIVIYCKMKNKALKRASDIHKIGRIKE